MSLIETRLENYPAADPPGSSPTLRRAARRLVSPIERFLSVESASGILLVLAAMVALVWANSPVQASYQALWHTSLGLRIAGHVFERDLHFWINDGLMTVFFFVIGLEIRRELHAGELADLRRAALPLVAAAGGMVFPALIYLCIAGLGGGARGWGVPMATDIAFAVGVLALLGRRVRPGLRILLLTLAVVDDLGAIVVITLFYSSTVGPAGALIALVGVGGILLMQRLGVRRPLLYAVPSLVIWAGLTMAGIHPALAGVVVGLLTPARAWDGREAISPAARLERALHPWAAFIIMPLFALANAGVSLTGASPAGPGLRVMLGIVVGLAVGKPLGIVAASWLATRLRLTALPTGVGWRELTVLGMVAGIGFTMALFIAALAFGEEPLLGTAKLAVLSGSAVSAAGALCAGRWLLRRASD